MHLFRLVAASLLTSGLAHAAAMSPNDPNAVQVTGFSVLGVNEYVSYPGRIEREYAAAGQVTLQTPDGTLSSWCVDLFDNLTPGTFLQGVVTTDRNDTGAALTDTQLGQIGGLVNAANGSDPLSPAAAAAFQNAIWSVEYGANFTFQSDDSAVAGLTATDLSNAQTGVFAPAGTVFALLSTGNQAQAFAAFGSSVSTIPEPVAEPASLALLSVALLGIGMVRPRKNA